MAKQAGKTGVAPLHVTLRTKILEILFAKIWKK
jgi:hypothetical protein